jgi:hypothetical protein
VLELEHAPPLPVQLDEGSQISEGLEPVAVQV